MLAGIKVLDLTRFLPGPYCSMILADLGAEVIKVESPVLGDPMRIVPPQVGGQSCYFMSINRNKKSIAFNLRRREGREIFLMLARTADVVIEGFKPAHSARLGIGYEHLQRVNPGVVYCSLSGYGQGGPYRDRPGHDINYVALAGMLDALGLPGDTVSMPGVQLADIGGALFAAIGILAALVGKRSPVSGAYVDASIFGAALSMMAFSAAASVCGGVLPQPKQSYLMGSFPCYNVYRTKDGRHMAVGALEPALWADLCEAIGREDLISKQFPEKTEQESVVSELGRIFARRTRAEWIEFLADKDVACEPVNTIEEALGTPQVTDRGMVLEIDHLTAGRLKLIGSPLRSSQYVPSRATPPPLLGQHTIEILQALGHDAETIRQLRATRVVATPEDVPLRRMRKLESLGRS